MQKQYLYTVFNRLSHCLQGCFIIMLSLTGFEIHFQNVEIFGFEKAVDIHTGCAIGFSIMLILMFFWYTVTGEWKQYLPRTKNVGAMIAYYSSGIFKGDAHPSPKSKEQRFNPLQGIVYFFINMIIIPIMFVSGLLYFFYNELPAAGIEVSSLEPIALVHTFFAFALVAFIFGHLYLATTGHKPWSNFKSMITGWDEVKVQPKAEDKA